MDRLHEVFGVKNDNQLGDALQVNRSTLGNWRSRDSVPYTICVDVALERGVSLDWLLTGEGSMYRENGGNTPAEPADSPRERAMLALWRELDEEAQRDIQRHAEEKKRLNTLEQRVAELEAVVVAGKRLA
ncbi:MULTISPECIES: helix-turn-helix transcriptional regulator [Pseudomonadaceae]|uniref:helix-turn-helix transcriptional regulator n=1 Tax=Pseudomonadaceae TaxID=135621 RepID=UPI00114EDFC7|nr:MULTISPECIES: helix-turn-helix transcriptional regulator [Pseudomonas]MCP1617060.1 hypothetical protein [Pseudomonas otitidis]